MSLKKEKQQPVESVESILKARGSKYGTLHSNGVVAGGIRTSLCEGLNATSLEPDTAEALNMIAAKMSRIVNGDPNYEDNWADIIGYAQLVLDRIREGK